MPERIRLFLPAILIIALAVSWTEQASGAAEECILKPSAPSPRGSHWYYSVDRSTRQKCWYLGPEGMKVRAPARQTEALRPPPKSMLRPAEEESGATISTIAETPPGDARSSENELTLAASNYSAESLKESFTGELAPITTAYAEEENAASPQADKSLVWPIVTSAEFAGSTRQPDSVFTTATLLIVFSAALGVVYLIVHLLRGPLLASRPGRSSLDRSSLGRRLGLGSSFSGSGLPLAPAPTHPVQFTRNLAKEKAPTANDPEDYIEASVQRLLQELKRRQHRSEPQEFERTTRKVTA